MHSTIATLTKSPLLSFPYWFHIIFICSYQPQWHSSAMQISLHVEVISGLFAPYIYLLQIYYVPKYKIMACRSLTECIFGSLFFMTTTCNHFSFQVQQIVLLHIHNFSDCMYTIGENNWELPVFTLPFADWDASWDRGDVRDNNYALPLLVIVCKFMRNLCTRRLKASSNALDKSVHEAA